MTTVIQSRFAGLSIEDDDCVASVQSQKKKSTAASTKKPDPQKKKKTATSTAAAKKKNKKPLVSDDQWEKWRQKDEEIVDGTYEAELTQAILLSKLEFDQQRNGAKLAKKQNDAEKKAPESVGASKEQKTQKKQKKKNVMSLGQFNDMVGGDEKKADEVQPEIEEQSMPPEDPKFFDRLNEEVQQELRRDKYKEHVLQRQQPSDEIINRVQFAEVLERKDKEIDKLNKEVSRLKEELLTVKTRNKKLCNILGQGEMRDKAEALVELEKLRQVQSELTAEVASLHAQLEQERSKNEKTKDKRYCGKPKMVRFDESTTVQK